MEVAREDLVELAGGRGGVIQGYTPIHSYLQLYLVQIVVVVSICFGLGQVVKKWNQPRVIAEVMAGVLLGPSALGIVPGFTDTLFPEESIESLTLTAHLGLVLFLFIVGLELDPSLLRSNVKKASALSLTAQAFTWALSLGVSKSMIYLLDDVIGDTSFILFIGVSLSVTAFPVLSRILTENSLLHTKVGALVVSSASVDEVCVWCLLALVVSTIDAGSPVDAFYVFLLLALHVGLMLTVVKKALLWLVRKISRNDTGPPSRGVMITCLVMTLVSAWITDFIGIDAIFGAFVAGIIVPREHSLHVRITEAVQDVVSVLLLPLYFAVSGLKTDMTLLNNPTSWGICVLTCFAACLGKIGAGVSVSKIMGFTNRESLAVGILINTRGLVELIILNIGLDAGVLTKEVMAIMVVMALVTTFMSAPLSTWVYPVKYHTLAGTKHSLASEEPGFMKGSLCRSLSTIPELGKFAQERLKLMVLVTNPSALDAVTRIARLFSGTQPIGQNSRGDERSRRQGSGAGVAETAGEERSRRNASGAEMAGEERTRRKTSAAEERPRRKTSAVTDDELVVHALRLVENTDRFTSDMRALEKGETLNQDSLAGILQGFLGLLMIKVELHISVGTPTDFSQDVTRLTNEHGISTVVFPWDAGTTHQTAQLARVEKFMETTQSQFVLAFNCHTAVLASNGLTLMVPFFGSDDDIAALLLALAIVSRDESAQLVVLSFIEPENPAEQRLANEGEQQNGSIMSMFDKDPAGEPDLEAGTAVQPKPNPGNPAPTSVATATADLPATGNGNAVAPVIAHGDRGNRWSPRELLEKAEGLAQVRVTPAWSLTAALGAMSGSSAAPSASAAVSIVKEVANAQSIGLVLSGCAGSGQAVTVSAQQRGARGEGAGTTGGRGMVSGALLDMVGDVTAGLLRSQSAPAVLAVRASMPVVSSPALEPSA